MDADVGRIAVLGAELFGWVPEKVLGVHARFANTEPDLLRRLVRALHTAARWCEDPANHEDLARLLGEPRHLNLPSDILKRTLDGRLYTAPGGALRCTPTISSCTATMPTARPVIMRSGSTARL